MDYNAHRIARAEHQHLVRSLPTVYDAGEHVLPPQPSRLSRLAAWLLNRVAALLTSFCRFANRSNSFKPTSIPNSILQGGDNPTAPLL